MAILTVGTLNHYIAVQLQQDANLRTVLVRGEISNFKQNFRSGHCYFSMKDADATIRAVMFRSHAARLPYTPQDGMHVLVQASVTVYEPNGVYQLNVTDMQPDGIGAQALALQQRREKLAKLGYFEESRKRPVPPMPHKIGIVTSASGAAKHDMLQILERRYPLCHACVYPCLVQGEQAPDSIVAALQTAGADGCDVILMGRGGGSAEDLAAFQAEVVAHAIYASPVPVISAVGHETDHCIADEVADLRAPTPSAAAELAVPDIRVLFDMVQMRERYLSDAMSHLLKQRAEQLAQLRNRLQLQTVEHRVQLQEEKLLALRVRLRRAGEQMLTQRAQHWKELCGRLEAVSPVAILQRGYSLVYDGTNGLVHSAAQVHAGDALHIRLASGCVQAMVTAVVPQEGETPDGTDTI